MLELESGKQCAYSPEHHHNKYRSDLHGDRKALATQLLAEIQDSIRQSTTPLALQCFPVFDAVRSLLPIVCISVKVGHLSNTLILYNYLFHLFIVIQTNHIPRQYWLPRVVVNHNVGLLQIILLDQNLIQPTAQLQLWLMCWLQLLQPLQLHLLAALCIPCVIIVGILE